MESISNDKDRIVQNLSERHMDAQLPGALLDQHLRNRTNDRAGEDEQEGTPDRGLYNVGRVTNRGCTQIVFIQTYGNAEDSSF